MVPSYLVRLVAVRGAPGHPNELGNQNQNVYFLERSSPFTMPTNKLNLNEFKARQPDGFS